VVIGPVELEIARHQFAAVADEMGIVLRRTAFSPNIKERADCSAAVFVPNGEMLAQAEHIPVHLGSMPASISAIAMLDIIPGRQYAVNDPYRGGTHLNDLTLVKPVFVGSDHIGWVANRAHHADVGGEAPGSMPAHATRLDQEGHVVEPTVAVMDGGWVESFVEPFLAATRTPEERRGDLAAQMGANEVGAARLYGLAAALGIDAFKSTTSALLDYGERRAAAAIAALPHGVFRFTDYMEWKGDLLPIMVSLSVDGDSVTADFAGTHHQVDGNINAVEAVTRSCLYYAARVATDPEMPANGGVYRRMRLVAPQGTLVNARPGAAVAAGNVETSQRIADVLLGAFAGAAPDRVPAASQGTMNNVLIGNDRFAYYETLAGGQGGSPFGPGESGVHTGMTNTLNTPIESLEQHYPFGVERYRLREGSGGLGRHTGGDGIERIIRFDEAATVSLMGERRILAPWGLAGGEAGLCGADYVSRHGRSWEPLEGKVTLEVEAGDRLKVETPGGGGWG